MSRGFQLQVSVSAEDGVSAPVGFMLPYQVKAEAYEEGSFLHKRFLQGRDGASMSREPSAT